MTQEDYFIILKCILKAISKANLNCKDMLLGLGLLTALTSMRPMQLDRKSMRKEKSEATLSICVASAMPHSASSVAMISCLTASSWLI